MGDRHTSGKAQRALVQQPGGKADGAMVVAMDSARKEVGNQTGTSHIGIL